MSKRENNFVEAYKNLRENKIRREENREKLINESIAQRDKFMDNYYSIRESREMKQRRHGQLMESCRDNALGTAIKAIFISALEAGTLTDNGIILAENMVDSWIKEKGGASKILTECQNKTYLLARISQIVEEAALLETEEIENIQDDKVPEDKEPETDVPENIENNDESSQQEDEVALAAKVIEKNLDAENDEEVKKALEVIKNKASGSLDDDKSEDDNGDPLSDTNFEDDVEEDNKKDDSDDKDDDEENDSNDEDNDEEDSDDKDEKDDVKESEDVTDDSEDVKDVEVPDDATTDSDDNETDTAEDIVDDVEDVPEEDITVDGDTENNGKVFDELEKEEDVKKAVELIRQRVADAEETFIKRNAEDKKAIDELIGRISDNVKTVEDLNDEADEKSQIAEESARLNKQKISEITENRPLSIMEKMTRNLHSNIVKDQVVREQYLTEEGNMDTALIVESAKIMYGFLETLNTLQLEKVDVNYIQNVLDEM